MLYFRVIELIIILGTGCLFCGPLSFRQGPPAHLQVDHLYVCMFLTTDLASHWWTLMKLSSWSDRRRSFGLDLFCTLQTESTQASKLTTWHELMTRSGQPSLKCLYLLTQLNYNGMSDIFENQTITDS